MGQSEKILWVVSDFDTKKELQLSAVLLILPRGLSFEIPYSNRILSHGFLRFILSFGRYFTR